MLKKIKGLLMWLILLVVFIILDIFSYMVMIGSIVFSDGSRAWRLAISKDQTINCSIGGDEDETFSSRCYRENHKKKYATLERLVDWLFYKLLGEIDHCKVSYLNEINKCKTKIDKHND